MKNIPNITDLKNGLCTWSLKGQIRAVTIAQWGGYCLECGNPYCPLSLPWVISEIRARSNLWALLKCGPKTNKQKNTKTNYMSNKRKSPPSQNKTIYFMLCKSKDWHLVSKLACFTGGFNSNERKCTTQFQDFTTRFMGRKQSTDAIHEYSKPSSFFLHLLIILWIE